MGLWGSQIFLCTKMIAIPYEGRLSSPPTSVPLCECFVFWLVPLCELRFARLRNFARQVGPIQEVNACYSFP